MIGDRQLRLIVRREVVERVRQRSFLIGLAISVAILIAVIALPRIFEDDSTTYQVGVVAGVPQAYADGLQGASSDTTRIEVRAYPDRAAAERAVADGDIRVALVGAGGPDGGALVVGSDRSDELEALVQGVNGVVGARLRLEGRGLSADEARDALAVPPLVVATAATSADATETDDRKTVALVTSFFLYFQLIGLGFIVASGVVEEKASRVIEILLAATRPRTLLAGKLVGIGIVGMLQIVAQAIAGLVLVRIFGGVDLDVSTIWIVALSSGFFVLGYALYALLFAAAASLVPRQEELQNVTTPLTLMVVGSFLLVFPTINSPDSTVLALLSYVPPISVLTMPLRIAAGEAGLAEGLVAAALLVVAIGGVLPIAARVYARSVLTTGSRVSLRKALGRGR